MVIVSANYQKIYAYSSAYHCFFTPASPISCPFPLTTDKPGTLLPPYPYCDFTTRLCERKCCPPPEQEDEPQTLPINPTYQICKYCTVRQLWFFFLLAWSTIPPYPYCDPTTSLCERHCCPPPMPFDEEVVTSMMVISGPEVQTRKWYRIYSIETRMCRLMQEVMF